jgi:hypothetical protein
MVVGLISTCAISAYHQNVVSSYCLTWSILQIIESENNTNIENFKHIVIEDLNNRCHEKVIYCLPLQMAILSTIFAHLKEKHVM